MAGHAKKDCHSGQSGTRSSVFRPCECIDMLIKARIHLTSIRLHVARLDTWSPSTSE
ncbi:hypothetical protein BAUCODRAFT_35412 [Baudoinia panamericana UAMH 10762]|uniref:Uncharacterized protein n=1 Tax=Baudoinia panamericana (strain UAMH 10762) TaxID=717646 RepID=M2MV19_BAUPA|nr:uncharacterized protein BAUCODRAFT_35412 [Baudoinia panamericana UAMH 10762]EMC95428.1 hypothetical protein BAUCODRAFT_35412 [Baudoinia panamericana UAMH 10762]